MTVGHRFGTVVFVGRPNVGKSTLLNAVVGERVSIVTPKAQTTRNRIAGIRSLPDAQLVLLDTPGATTRDGALNRRLRRILQAAWEEADVTVLVVDASRGIGAEEESLLRRADSPALVVAINKIDAVRKSAALPLISRLATLVPGVPAVPVSAARGMQLDALLGEVVGRLPPGPPMFGADDYTTATTRFLAQEVVREQVFLHTRQEIPYGAAVVVEEIESAGTHARVRATILVARESHKGIVIGAGGRTVKAIGEEARPGVEALLGRSVHLEIRVRTEPDWLTRPERLAATELA